MGKIGVDVFVSEGSWGGDEVDEGEVDGGDGEVCGNKCSRLRHKSQMIKFSSWPDP